MINILIQVLILLSALLINFFIPLLFGLEQYGLFIKANILVFFFHKFIDIVSEPLTSMVDRNICFPASLTLGLVLLAIFSLCNFFFTVGYVLLLAAMIWSSCVLLTMYSYQLRLYILSYLICFTALFLSLLFLAYFQAINISISKLLIITNFLPAAIFFILLIVKNKIEIKTAGYLQSLYKIIGVFPGLFSLTLVNNLFTNILPFYLSFILPPQLLGLFRVQVSLAQSVTAIFPINTKIISTHFVSQEQASFLNKISIFSLNYFYLIALFGFIATGVIEKYNEFALVFFIMPILHLAMIFERALLGLKQRKELMLINYLVVFSVSICAFFIHNINQIIMVYSLGISLYIILMMRKLNFDFHGLIKILAFLTPLEIFAASQSTTFGIICLFINTLLILRFMPINRNALSIIGF